MSTPTVLVMGFGPFLNITDNPATRVALDIDGMRRGALRFVGRVMPVSFSRCIAATEQALAEIQPEVVVGVGVAQRREVITVEGIGRNIGGPTPDVDGVACSVLSLDGPTERAVTLPVGPLAAGLGAVVGRDAGRYVCNAWIYHMLCTPRTEPRIGFIHIPPAGLNIDRLADVLAEMRGKNNGIWLEAE